MRAVIGEKMEAGFPPSRALGFGMGFPIMRPPRCKPSVLVQPLCFHTGMMLRPKKMGATVAAKAGERKKWFSGCTCYGRPPHWR